MQIIERCKSASVEEQGQRDLEQAIVAETNYDKIMPLVAIGGCQLLFGGTLMIVINQYFSEYLQEPEPCGIPIVWWNYMYWTINFCFTFTWVITIAVGFITADAKIMTILMWSFLAIQF